MELGSLPTKQFIHDLVTGQEERIINKLSQQFSKQKGNSKFYRNKDLRKIFGIDGDTIKKYRENGTLPHTWLGNVPLYPIDKIQKILKDNSQNMD